MQYDEKMLYIKKVAKNEKIIENTNGNEKIDLIGREE